MIPFLRLITATAILAVSPAAGDTLAQLGQRTHGGSTWHSFGSAAD